VLDFTSALYLGMQHPSRSLPPWEQLTRGVPAALEEPERASDVAGDLAALTGCERVLLSPSTLHLFWDVFGSGLVRGRPVFVDAGAYPIARWGTERAAAQGGAVADFPHHDAEALAAVVRRSGSSGRRPVVVTDGLCPSCGGPAPLREYLKVVQRCRGTLVIDDTQALGILGAPGRPGQTWGTGGGGSLRWHGLEDEGVLVISSLAKGFGAPVAMLGGDRAAVLRFERDSETRVHCSPPSAASISAAAHAIAVNQARGDTLRRRLDTLLRRFRTRLAAHGIGAIGDLFPVQTLAPSKRWSATALHEALLRMGVRTVVHRDRHGRGARLSLLITAGHRPADIDYAVSCVARGYAAQRTA
jgi:8-amino-7-oxononanoate synthase